MDFNFSGTDDKLTGGETNKTDVLSSGAMNIDKQQFQGHGDHSPTKLIDISGDDDKLQQNLQHNTDGSGSNDDFEHVYHDDPFTGNKISIDNKGEKNATASNDNMGFGAMDDFLGSTKPKLDNFKNDVFNDFQTTTTDLLQNLEKKINQTADFIAAEKGNMNKITTQPPSSLSSVSSTITSTSSVPPVSDNTSSYSDAFSSLQQQNPAATVTTSSFESDYQKEHYNPSPIKKSLKDENDEKFISSEDLLGDFKDERMKTPEPMINLKTVESKKEPDNKYQHSGIEDLLTDNEKIAANAALKSAENIKEDIMTSSKISGSGIGQKPEKLVEEITSTKVKPSAIVTEMDKKKKNEPAPPASQKMISAEEIFYRYGLDTWFKPQCLHPKVESLIYWRDVKKSGIVFGAGLLILLAISCFSVISVFAYLSLTALAGTIAFRIYKTVMGAVQKTSEGHPFKEYLEMDLNLPHEKVQQIVNVSVAHVNGFVSELRRLFLVEDLVDSIKFGVILWVLTYVGAWFNGMTLVILAFVSLFTLPKVYENNKQSIDTYLDLVRSKILEITDKVKAAVPIGKKPETDKDK